MTNEDDRDILKFVHIANQRTKCTSIHVFQHQVGEDQIEMRLPMLIERHRTACFGHELEPSFQQQVRVPAQESMGCAYQKNLFHMLTN
jgi:hypothetical protein